ncbi:MAG: C25 family cysteine peptidase, partial [Anaerolineae bacterium]
LEDIITSPSELVNTLTADIGGLAVGNHEVRVVALKGGQTLEATRPLVVEQGEPGLEVTRSIRREGNTLKVTLDLHNAGQIALQVNKIVDNIQKLQQVNRTDASGAYTVKASHGEWTGEGHVHRRTYVAIEFPSALTLGPGEDYSVYYVAVPILYEFGCPAYIGDRDVAVIMNRTTSSQQVAYYKLLAQMVNDPSYGMLPLQEAIENAVRQADYVIVTNRMRVFSHLVGTFEGSSQQDAKAETLFANMAELASLENGVLGYTYSYSDKTILNEIIQPGGQWAEALNPVFNETDQGYVLIVGETEIVKAWYVGESNFVTYVGIPDKVYDSDLRYADTRGETARPELVVGRVIGNDLTVLNTYLDNIIRAARGEPGYGFHRSKAYVCNGNGDGEWTFQSDAEEVDDQLDARYDESIWINFMNDGAEAQKAYHLQYLPNRDLVLYRGHGNQDAWDDGLLASDVLGGMYDLDSSTNPAMLAAACTTGNYENDNDLNLAEVLLAQGVGAYVGATGKSERWANSDAFVAFVPRWQPY